MRFAFDTSVIVAGLVASHPHHRRAVVWLHASREGTHHGVRSGALYDALHYQIATRTDCEAIVTFNERDFTRFAVGDGPRVIVPPGPPAR